MEFLREESSEERYATELARFCLVSLRLTYSMDQADGAALSNAGMRLNFTQDCLARLGELAQWIRSQSQLWALGPTNAQREHGCRVIQALFFEVFTGGLSESQWHDGIVLYTGIQALRASGWQDAKDMTGLFAKFKYLIRISIIHKVMDDSNDPSEYVPFCLLSLYFPSCFLFGMTLIGSSFLQTMPNGRRTVRKVVATETLDDLGESQSVAVSRLRHGLHSRSRAQRGMGCHPQHRLCRRA
jgi:hypothetical protein